MSLRKIAGDDIYNSKRGNLKLEAFMMWVCVEIKQYTARSLSLVCGGGGIQNNRNSNMLCASSGHWEPLSAMLRRKFRLCTIIATAINRGFTV